jgi:hypothetical protein
VRAARRIGYLLAAATALALAGPATAPAAVSVTSYKITSNMPAFPAVPADGPSTLQAGAFPDAGSFSTFGYPNEMEDVKTAITNFAPGLLGNPEAVPKCPQSALTTGGTACPAGSAIGTSRLDTQVAAFGVPGPSFAGVVYNAEPLGNEPGRLGVVTPTSASTFLVSSIPFEITPRGGDYGLTGTLTDIDRLPAQPPAVPDLQVTALGFVLNSTSKYVRNPTSCGAHVNTGQASGYDDPTVAASPPYTFTTVGCEAVPFSPTVSLELGDTQSSTRDNAFPTAVIRIAQDIGEADLRNTNILLPTELNTNNRAYKLCTEAQAAGDQCPADSQFGEVEARSPFLRDPLRGPVYLLSQANRPLPGLLLDLRGRAHVHIATQTQLINNRQIQSLTTDAPQLPISELRISLEGGRDTGVFQNRRNLCLRGRSSKRVNPVTGRSTLVGWNGKSTGEVRYSAKVNGCGPRVSARIGGAYARRPRLSLTMWRHPDAPNLSELTVSLSHNLSLRRRALRREAIGRASVDLPRTSIRYAGRHRLRITGLPQGGSTKVAIRLTKGAVKVRKDARKRLRRGRSARFRVKVQQTPVTGRATTTKASFRGKGRRR